MKAVSTVNEMARNMVDGMETLATDHIWMSISRQTRRHVKATTEVSKAMVTNSPVARAGFDARLSKVILVTSKCSRVPGQLVA